MTNQDGRGDNFKILWGDTAVMRGETLGNFFTTPTVMKSGLHVKAVSLSDKWFLYPVSFDRIATVALNQ